MTAKTASPNSLPTRHVISRRLAGVGATAALAGEIAALVRPGDVIALAGGLGCGKTTFARAFIRTLATLNGEGDPDEEVPSPTFTMVQIFESAISLVEWPKNLGCLLPTERLDLDLEFSDESDGDAPKGDISESDNLENNASGEPRLATLTGYGAWAARLEGLENPPNYQTERP
jgi:tRNA A37 threonylcarbamoyladenosine biosynthesis protein TsaE